LQLPIISAIFTSHMVDRRNYTATQLERLRKHHFTKGQAQFPNNPSHVKRGLPKKTMEFVDRMEELGCRPEEFLARVIIGQEPPKMNPFYDLLELWLTKNKDKALTSQRISQLLGRARKYLMYEPAPLEIRVNAARDLMQYKYPKRKAVEHSGNVQVGTGVMLLQTPMDEEKWVEQAEHEAAAILEHVDYDE